MLGVDTAVFWDELWVLAAGREGRRRCAEILTAPKDAVSPCFSWPRSQGRHFAKATLHFPFTLFFDQSTTLQHPSGPLVTLDTTLQCYALVHPGQTRFRPVQSFLPSFSIFPRECQESACFLPLPPSYKFEISISPMTPMAAERTDGRPDERAAHAHAS